ncbi:site-specific DNA-methyltransferase [Sphingobacterium faecium]|uniref:site-specific DNA-methyltransferase n=1 Tax=Sphingobacterium faecium TaxID=34087 RepID=UPI00320A753A
MSVEKMDMQSPNLVNQNIEKLAELFPNCVTESAGGKAIDFDLLRHELSDVIIEGNKERYRLEWPGKKEAIVTANMPITKTLRPVREDSVDFDNTENIYIEGDNLEVLKLLQESYLGKVKMIYIDPPYNTGKDFVYKDNFAKDTQEELFDSGQKDEYNQRLVVNPETAGRYHSDWLTMMYPRLKLARNLLTDDGVVFISIDDNELNNLSKICDEIFGESNNRGIISRPTGTPSGQGNEILVNEIDYILVYSKSQNSSFFGMPFSKDDEKIYDQSDEFGRYLIRSLRKTGGEDRKEDRPTMSYGIKTPDGTIIYPIGPTGYESRWRCGEDSYFKLLKENLIEWKFSKDGWKPFQKFYLEGRKKQPSNLWQNIEGNKKASLTVKSLFQNKVFDTPKPVELIEKCLRISTIEESIVLDFFSGSATTAHAVIKLNAEEKESKRKYIMVQLPEATDEKSEAYKAGYKNICEIGKERIRRAANKIKEETGADIDYGFRVYRLDESNMQDVYYKPQNYSQTNLDLFADNVKSDRTSDDLLAQVMLDWGLPLSLKIERLEICDKEVFRVAENSLYACFEKGINEEFAKELSKDKPLRVVFRDSGFSDDTAKVNVKQLLKQLSPETDMKVI